MLAWSEGTDNGRQKTRNHGYDVIVGGELFTDYSDHSQTCHAKPKTQIAAPDATSFFPLVDAYRKQFAWKTSSKSQDAVALQQYQSVALYPWLIVDISSGNRPLQ